jgi:hypothetical protein
MKPEIIFETFTEEEDTDLDEDHANIQSLLIVHFPDEDAPLKLAEMLIDHFRKYGGDRDFCVPGQLWITHYDESLPPSPIDGEKLPQWLQKITNDYRKPEVARLLGIIRAAESSEPDSFFNEEENEHRRTVRSVQDEVFGSREELRELLDAARTALQHYAAGSDPETAKQALAFIER